MQFWAKSFAPVRACRSSILSRWNTVSEQPLTRVYTWPPFLSHSPQIFLATALSCILLQRWAEVLCFYLFIPSFLYLLFICSSFSRSQTGRLSWCHGTGWDCFETKAEHLPESLAIWTWRPSGFGTKRSLLKASLTLYCFFEGFREKNCSYFQPNACVAYC